MWSEMKEDSFFDALPDDVLEIILQKCEYTVDSVLYVTEYDTIDPKNT